VSISGIDSNSKIVDRAGKDMVISDVKIGDEVKVKGLVDKSVESAWKITKVYKLMDRSLPVK